jgi:3-hydroxymyristoyl/3-hydroxydecanoyl-(acyl carrier protein) dehydratase
MSFTFVDRIAEIEPGRRARGSYRVPASWRELPPWLVAEAIGQLAAWVAMAGTDFRRRPVAAIAGEVSPPPANSSARVLELEVEVERRDDNAIVYRGAASSEGCGIGALERCVGPMLPMEEFDDPESVRRRYAALCGHGLELVAVEDPMPLLVPSAVENVNGELLRARLVVPADAAFFREHFPRKPVLPATLLMALQVALAVRLTTDASGASPRLAAARHVKVRSFTEPGTALDLEARVQSRELRHAHVAVRASAGDRIVSTARIVLEVDGGA